MKHRTQICYARTSSADCFLKENSSKLSSVWIGSKKSLKMSTMTGGSSVKETIQLNA